MSAPLVTVIVPHHLDINRPYVDLCIKSIAATEGVDFELIILCDSDTVPYVNGELFDRPVRIVYDKKLDNAHKKVTMGVEIAHPGSKYFMIISDDVMITKNTIAQLVEACGEYGAIANPASNGENKIRFETKFTLETPYYSNDYGYGAAKTLYLPNTLDYEDIKGFEHAVIDYPVGPNFIIPQAWVSFYCTMIPRTLWQTLGGLDPALDLRCNDEDFCRRASKAGGGSVLHLGAFCLHFGTKTLKHEQDYLKRSDLALEHFKKKWTDPQRKV